MSYKFKYGNTEIEVPKKSESLCYQYDLGNNVNLNSLTMEGYYHQALNANASTTLNYPIAEAGLLTVIKRGYIYQTYHTYCNSGFWYRSQYNGSWYPWKKSADTNLLTWNNMSGKPTSYTPTNHNHAYATWLGAQYASGGDWLGFYSAYGGSRRGYLQHTASSFYILSETGNIILSPKTDVLCNANLILGNVNFISGRTTSGASVGMLVRGDDNNVYVGYYNNGTIIRGSFCKLGSSSGATITSDRNLKKNITPLNDYELFFSKLKPVSFVYDITHHKRTHLGFISQDVEKALKESSLNNEKFSGLCIDKISNCQIYDEDSDEIILLNKGIKEIYSLRYEEFIALNTHMIQKQQTEIDSLKKEIQELKEMILSL